jgi:signal transduction histidine kinase/ActR/RegA family two-component response regulator
MFSSRRFGEFAVAFARPNGDAARGVPRQPTIVAFWLLALAGVAAIVGTFMTARAERWSAHSLEVRQAEAQLFSAVQDTETGQRGYLLTGQAVYLGPFTQAKARLSALQSKVRALTADNPVQRARLTELDALIAAKVGELDRSVALRRQGRADEALAVVLTHKGLDVMDRIRTVAADFDASERQLLQHRQDNARRLRTALGVLVPLSVLLAALLGALGARAARLYEAELESRNRALAAEMDAREKAEAQLRQAQKMDALGQLTGGVAHDFNNMLAIIVGNLDILLRRLGPQDDRIRETALSALGGANRAAALTQRLLAFSRLQPLDPKPTDVNKCVGEMSELLRRTLGETILVEAVLAGGLWRALIDCPQLESAILNLAVNARDAMPGGGRLTLETSNAALDQAYADDNIEVIPGQYVLVAVTDTGQGMSPEVMTRAFDPFFTTKGVGEGTGLGLSQVHGFLKQSRGHIKIYSEAGVGTTVKLYLPRDVSGRLAEEPPRDLDTRPIEQRFAVLVVEDDADVRQLAAATLRELGYKVLEADSAAVALERLEANPGIDVLLTDVVMPVTDGRKLADAALPRWPHLRVLYMTGYTRNAIVHNGVLDPGARLISKPFTIEQLDRELRLILSDKLGAI